MLSRNQKIVLLLILVCGRFLLMHSPASSETPIQNAGPQAHCDLLQLQARRYILNLNRVNLPFIQNQGQFDEDVRFAAIGLSGNTIYLDNDGDVRFSLSAIYGKPVATATMIYMNATPTPNIVAGEPLPSVTRYLSNTKSDNSLRTLRNFDRVIRRDLYEGISASYTSTSRQFITDYLIQPTATLKQIRLRIPTAQSMKIDDATGNLILVLFGGRTLKIHPVALKQESGAGYISYRAEGRDTFSLNLTEVVGRIKNPVVLESRITLGPDFHEYDAVQNEHDSVFAASTAFNTRERGLTKSGGDVILARLDSSGKRILATTIIAGSADDEAAGIAVSRKGDVYVVGSTASKDFPISRSFGNSGSVAAFVVKFDEDLSRLVSGNYVGSLTRAHDVNITEQGDVLVTGTAEGRFVNVNPANLNFKTIFPVDNSANQTYFIAELEPNLGTTRHSFAFKATRVSSPITITIDCQGLISLGVVPWQLTCGVNASLQSTQMSQWANSISNGNFPGVTNSSKIWGRHPISWKAYVAASTHTFNSNSVSPTLVPSGGVYNTDGPKLDQIEAGGAFHLSGGGPVSDPDGVWNVNRYDDNGSGQNPQNVLELALGASFYHICCGSPVYTGYLETQCNNLIPFYDPMVIRQVNLCINNTTSGSPQTLQQALGPAWLSNPGGGDTHDFPYLAAAQLKLSFESFDAGVWRSSGFVVANNQKIGCQWQLSPNLAWYIADPPQAQRFIADNIQEAAGQLRDSMYAATDLQATAYRNGRPAGGERYTGQIRVRDFPFHPIRRTRERF